MNGINEPTDRRTTIGSIVFGPRWDNPTAVGSGDGETFIPQPVYQHEMRKLLDKIAELEARLSKLEAPNE